MSRPRKYLVLALGIAGAVLSVHLFYGVGHTLDDYDLPYGTGMAVVDPRELSFLVWYVTFGVLATACATAALAVTTVPDTVERWVRAWADRPAVPLAAMLALTLAAILLLHHVVLQGAPVTADDYSYVFAGETLARGRLVNPAPDGIELFHRANIVVNEYGWWSKYPIGHSLVLALGALLSLPFLLPALLVCACVALTWAIGRRLAGGTVGVVAALLLVLSPQFAYTGATWLSQPTSCLWSLLAVYAFVRLCEDGRARWALLTGAALGAGVLTRPMPGLLFVAVLPAFWLLRSDKTWPERLRALALAALPLAIAAAAMLAVQWAQTGDALRTGYEVAHGRVGWRVPTEDYTTAVSVGSAIARLNVWAFGWPIGLALLLWVRDPRLRICIGMLAAVFAYRLLAPKVGMSPTGPIYVYEALPFLAILTADGARHLGRWMSRAGAEHAARTRTALLVAATAVGLACFAPVQVGNLYEAAQAWNTPARLVREHTAQPALVFADRMVAESSHDTWAFLPPPPSPSLDDAIIFVRPPTGPDAAQTAVAYWRRNFPERRAFVLRFRDGLPRLSELRDERDLAAPPGARP